MKTTKLTIGRLFNLGSYEHIRYEITVELNDGDSAEKAIIGLEKIMECIKPEKNTCVKTRSDLRRDAARIAELKAKLVRTSEDQFRNEVGHFVGTPIEYIARLESSHIEEMGKRISYETRCRKARALLDNLGGAETFKDCKLSWEDETDWSDGDF